MSDRYSTNPLYKQSEVYPTAMVVDPSAPPAYPTSARFVEPTSVRVVQPFSISVDETTPLRYDGDNYGDFSNPQLQGRRDSRLLDERISRAHSDGIKIVDHERDGAAYSERIGYGISNQIDRKLNAANRDKVDNLEIRSIPSHNNFDITQVTDFRYDATKDVIKKDQSSSGYVMQEYKSIYEKSNSSGEYQMSEYKSIYE